MIEFVVGLEFVSFFWLQKMRKQVMKCQASDLKKKEKRTEIYFLEFGGE